MSRKHHLQQFIRNCHSSVFTHLICRRLMCTSEWKNTSQSHIYCIWKWFGNVTVYTKRQVSASASPSQLRRLVILPFINPLLRLTLASDPGGPISPMSHMLLTQTSPEPGVMRFPQHVNYSAGLNVCWKRQLMFIFQTDVPTTVYFCPVDCWFSRDNPATGP